MKWIKNDSLFDLFDLVDTAASKDQDKVHQQAGPGKRKGNSKDRCRKENSRPIFHDITRKESRKPLCIGDRPGPVTQRKDGQEKRKTKSNQNEVDVLDKNCNKIFEHILLLLPNGFYY